MSSAQKIQILYFTDILCVWAYLEQIRIDELKSKFDLKVDLDYHFIPIFGSVKTKMKNDWESKGGVKAYSEFVNKISEKFDHIEIHPDIWVKNTPTTSINSHVFLKAIQILEKNCELSLDKCVYDSGRSVFETAMWKIRSAFFKNLVDVSNNARLLEIGEELNLPVHKIQALINNGEAQAAVNDDLMLMRNHDVKGSPTLVFNEGRQVIYGNVGYKVIEANIEELLRVSDDAASWC